jgi:hypothetical protein
VAPQLVRGLDGLEKYSLSGGLRELGVVFILKGKSASVSLRYEDSRPGLMCSRHICRILSILYHGQQNILGIAR